MTQSNVMIQHMESGYSCINNVVYVAYRLDACCKHHAVDFLL